MKMWMEKFFLFLGLFCGHCPSVSMDAKDTDKRQIDSFLSSSELLEEMVTLPTKNAIRKPSGLLEQVNTFIEYSGPEEFGGSERIEITARPPGNSLSTFNTITNEPLEIFDDSSTFPPLDISLVETFLTQPHVQSSSEKTKQVRPQPLKERKPTIIFGGFGKPVLVKSNPSKKNHQMRIEPVGKEPFLNHQVTFFHEEESDPFSITPKPEPLQSSQILSPVKESSGLLDSVAQGSVDYDLIATSQGNDFIQEQEVEQETTQEIIRDINEFSFPRLIPKIRKPVLTVRPFAHQQIIIHQAPPQKVSLQLPDSLHKNQFKGVQNAENSIHFHVPKQEVENDFQQQQLSNQNNFGGIKNQVHGSKGKFQMGNGQNGNDKGKKLQSTSSSQWEFQPRPQQQIQQSQRPQQGQPQVQHFPPLQQQFQQQQQQLNNLKQQLKSQQVNQPFSVQNQQQKLRLIQQQKQQHSLNNNFQNQNQQNSNWNNNNEQSNKNIKAQKQQKQPHQQSQNFNPQSNGNHKVNFNQHVNNNHQSANHQQNLQGNNQQTNHQQNLQGNNQQTNHHNQNNNHQHQSNHNQNTNHLQLNNNQNLNHQVNNNNNNQNSNQHQLNSNQNINHQNQFNNNQNSNQHQLNSNQNINHQNQFNNNQNSNQHQLNSNQDINHQNQFNNNNNQNSNHFPNHLNNNNQNANHHFNNQNNNQQQLNQQSNNNQHNNNQQHNNIKHQQHNNNQHQNNINHQKHNNNNQQFNQQNNNNNNNQQNHHFNQQPNNNNQQNHHFNQQHNNNNQQNNNNNQQNHQFNQQHNNNNQQNQQINQQHNNNKQKPNNQNSMTSTIDVSPKTATLVFDSRPFTIIQHTVQPLHETIVSGVSVLDEQGVSVLDDQPQTQFTQELHIINDLPPEDENTNKPTADDPDGDGIIGIAGTHYPSFAHIFHTSFQCNDKPILPGTYADMEARCQMYHSCGWDGSKTSFLCSPGTVFNQKYLICDWWYNVNCNDSPNFYSINTRFSAVANNNDQNFLEQSNNNVQGGNGEQSNNNVQRGNGEQSFLEQSNNNVQGGNDLSVSSSQMSIVNEEINQPINNGQTEPPQLPLEFFPSAFSNPQQFSPLP